VSPFAPSRAAKGTQADLSAGTLVFSASQIAAMDVIADDAHIHAAANVPAVGQISITGPKTLYVFANHGALAISFHGDSDVISEGESYCVVLDPPDDASGKADPDPAKRSSRGRKGFLLLLIGAAADIATTWHKRSDLESPDHP
jgi:hypothetical protein